MRENLLEWIKLNAWQYEEYEQYILVTASKADLKQLAGWWGEQATSQIVPTRNSYQMYCWLEVHNG